MVSWSFIIILVDLRFEVGNTKVDITFFLQLDSSVKQSKSSQFSINSSDRGTSLTVVHIHFWNNISKRNVIGFTGLSLIQSCVCVQYKTFKSAKVTAFFRKNQNYLTQIDISVSQVVSTEVFYLCTLCGKYLSNLIPIVIFTVLCCGVAFPCSAIDNRCVLCSQW